MLGSQENVTKPAKQARSNEIRRRLTSQQYKAIRLAAEIGDNIRKNYPEIAKEYRSGQTAPILLARHEFDHRHGISQRTAINAVRYVLRGYFGPCSIPYDSLIADKSEQQYLALDHNKQTGIEAFIRKNGIHSLTREQKIEVGRKGGLIRGPLSYQLRIGCHAIPHEVLREHLRRIAPLGWKMGGVASVIAKGLIPFVPAMHERIAEIEFSIHLAGDPLYHGPIRANYKKISERVNLAFNSGDSGYTRTSLKIALQRLRSCNRSSVESIVDPKLSFAEKLASDPAYQIPARIKAAEIARKVNEEYHSGKPVRNSLSISDAIRRYRLRNANYGVGWMPLPTSVLEVHPLHPNSLTGFHPGASSHVTDRGLLFITHKMASLKDRCFPQTRRYAGKVLISQK
jgi:hypothetical protein